MTDKLRAAAEMALEALNNYVRDERFDGWAALDAISILRQALDQLPDATKMIEEPPNSTTDVVEREPFGWLFKQADGDLYKLLRGEDAKWHEKNNPSWIKVSPLYTAPPKDVVEPIGEVQIEQMGRPFNAGKVVLHFYGEPPPVGTKLYAAPPKPDLLNQTCCECGRSGGYALYCGQCWEKGK